MAEENRKVLHSLGAKDAPSWPLRAFRKLITRIDPEIVTQDQGGIVMTRYGVVRAEKSKSGRSTFGEITGGSGNQFVIDRPGGGNTIDPSRALDNNRGFVYAAVNAIAREVMTIDWRLFEVDGKDEKERPQHEALDLLDTCNDSMISLEFKYLLSACLTLTGNAYVYLEGVKSDLGQPKAIHLMPPDKVKTVIDRRSWPFQVLGYTMKLETREYVFQPYEVIHLKLPNPSDFFSGYSPVFAAAEYIDNDNYAQEFNRKFFKNGARPAGFLETTMVAETQLEALKIGFANLHGGIDNMNGIAVLPNGVKWAGVGASPKDMDFKNLSEDSKERILMMFGTSKTILGTAESDTNRACYDDQTEVLTENGWKKYCEVKQDERIAEYDGVTNEVRFAIPLGKYVYPYKGKMLHFENCKMDIMVTPDHRMWYRPDHKGANYRIALAEELPKVCHFKAAAPQNGGHSPQIFSIPYYEKGSHPENKSRNFMMEDWLEFLGYVISEGGVSSGANRIITLYQKKHPHTKRIMACLKRLKKSGCLNFGFYPDKEDGGTRFNVYGAPIMFWMHDNIGSYANEKHLPSWVFELDMRQRRILFDALMLGDGSIDPREKRQSGYYSTTSHQLADDVQRLAFSLGIQSHADIHYEANGNRNTCYRVMFDFGSTEQQLDWKHRDMRHEVDYDGNVWCFKTTTGLFVTRRNGKIALQGNTAETADYVFSKRVVKPHMLLICAFLNEKLLPRYGDNIYLSFIDPVPEDRAARTTEMTTAVGGQPILTVDEARDEFMGLGPTEGGDKLMSPTAMAPADEPKPDPQAGAGGGEPKPAPVNDENDEGEEEEGKMLRRKVQKTMNGGRVAFRPTRTSLQKRAKQRTEMRESLAAKIKADLTEALKRTTKKFVSTKEQDEAVAKEFTEYTAQAEKEIAATVGKINAEQKKEVLENLPRAIEKGVDPTKIFDLDNWISITTNAMTPIMETLFAHEAAVALAEIGTPDLNPFNDTAKAALHASIAKMSESYQTTVRDGLEGVINDGLSSGQSLDEMSKAIGDRYTDLDGYAADRIAKTESFRTSNSALKTAWKESGVVKTVRWYVSGKDNSCDFCLELNGKVMSIDDNFLNSGDPLTVGDEGSEKTMTANYGDVSAPPLHPNCSCLIRPNDVSL